MSAGIAYSPESMTYTLFDGTNSLKLPNWAHRVIHEEFEREVRPLNSKIEMLSDALALARAENAKLRELVETLLPDAMENVCSKSYWCDEKDWQACGDKSCGSHLYVELARELGIEVDGWE